MSEENEPGRGAVVYRSTKRRTFKACRTCRLQKSRCIVEAEVPPCKRCQATGRDCVFEELGSTSSAGSAGGSSSRKRSYHATDAEDEGDKRARYPDLEKEVVELRQIVNSIREVPRASLAPEEVHRPTSSRSQQVLSSRSNPNHGVSERDRRCSILNEDAPSSEALTVLRLDAPITAVHAMIVTGVSPSPSSAQSQGRSPRTSLLSHSDTPGRVPSLTTKYDDVISEGLVTESEGRKLFQLYMANANVFLPLFDPTVDTFDALRQRSPFCFAVILAIALRAEYKRSEPGSKGEKCFQKAQNLAAKSLFATSARLETIQGMILLAANSESNWFAISHAYQMGRDMGFHDLVHDGVDMLDSETPTTFTKFNDRSVVRRMRTAMILHHVEKEVASGTARPSKGSAIHDVFLKRFLRNKFSNTYDMRIVANVELTQLRGRLLQDLDLQSSLIGRVQDILSMLQRDINVWFDRWDRTFQDQDFSIGCFQRSSIRLQRDYAFIIISSSMISKLSRHLADQETANMMTDEMSELVELTLQRSMKILNFITGDNDYKWYLQWAPTYSALFPAFTAALAFRLAKMKPSFLDWRALQTSFATVAEILQGYPYQTFSQIIQDLSRLASDICDLQSSAQSSGVFRSIEHNSGVGATATTSQVPIHAEGAEAQGTGMIGEQAEAPQSPIISHEITRPFESAYDIAADRNCWDLASLSHEHVQDDALGIDEASFQPSLGTPDYAFDFNLFAASIQASMDMPGSDGT